jgi:hypothetical protein
MIPLKQAVQAHPVLAGVAQRIERSQRMLATILPLLPAGLRSQVAAGPVDESSWCLFVRNAAVASKLRQLSPTLLQALQREGLGVAQLRLKVRA